MGLLPSEAADIGTGMKSPTPSKIAEALVIIDSPVRIQEDVR
jgi:hypothetical protein